MSGVWFTHVVLHVEEMRAFCLNDTIHGGYVYNICLYNYIYMDAAKGMTNNDQRTPFYSLPTFAGLCNSISGNTSVK